jgi:hypothetical protein
LSADPLDARSRPRSPPARTPPPPAPALARPPTRRPSTPEITVT